MSGPTPPTPNEATSSGAGLHLVDDPELADPPKKKPAEEAPAPAAAAAPSPKVPAVTPARLMGGDDNVRRVLGLDRGEDDEQELPAWVRIPDGFSFPRGRRVQFVRFPAEWTDVPKRGHECPDAPGLWRQCILWSLSPGDEQLAAERALGDDNRLTAELIKQSIRAIDGQPVDQTGMPTEANVDRFWAQIGSRCRGDLKRIWSALNNSTREQRTFFLAFCVAQRVAG